MEMGNAPRGWVRPTGKPFPGASLFCPDEGRRDRVGQLYERNSVGTYKFR